MGLGDNMTDKQEIKVCPHCKFQNLADEWVCQACGEELNGYRTP